MNILNKFKRGMAGLLSLSVAVSAVFVFHFPLIRAHAENDEVHSHTASQGGEDGDWKPWPPQSEEVEGNEEGEENEETETVEVPVLPDSSGYYYLTENVEINDTWIPKDGTYLCLNGYSITMTASGAVVSVEFGAEFTLCDCSKEDSGVITHRYNAKGSGVEVSGNCTFNMYGGTISDNNTSGNGGGVSNGGTFNMHGGTICNNSSSRGGGVYSEDGAFKMSGGSISNNSASVHGGGVYTYDPFEMFGGRITGNDTNGQGGGVFTAGSSQMTVGGAPNITGNSAETPDETTRSKADSNVYLSNDNPINISEDTPLRGKDTEIGVTGRSNNGTIAQSTDGKNYRLFFVPDNADYGEYTAYSAGDGTITYAEVEPENEEVPPVPRIDSDADNGNNGDNEGGDENGGDDNKGDENGNNDNKDDENGGNDNKDKEEHTHDGLEEWTKTNSLPEDEGSYYLHPNGDIVLASEQDISEDVTLCLNGRSIRMVGDNTTILVTGSLTLHDCHGGYLTPGNIYSTTNGNAITIQGGDLAIYGGMIGNPNGTTYGSGVVFAAGGTGTLTVGGATEIIAPVVLPAGKTITIDGLDKDAKIHVKLETPLAEGESVAVTGTIAKELVDCIISDDEYTVKYNKDNSTVVFANGQTEETETPGGDDKPNNKHEHGAADTTEWKPFLDENGEFPTSAGHYYLTEDILSRDVFVPGDTVITLCLNGHRMNSLISVTSPNFILCDCVDTVHTATVTVGENGTVTVGGKLKADITLGKGALIAYDSSYPLEYGAKITVYPATPLAEGESIKIKETPYGNQYFEAATGYEIEEADDALWLKKGKAEKPPVDPTKHTHPICGDIDCKEHLDFEWEAWGETTYLPTEAGYYYLTDDVKLFDSPWAPANNTYLCLNGYSVTLANKSGTPVIEIGENVGFTLCDCAMFPNGNNSIVNNLKSATTVAQVNKQINDNGLGTIGGSTASGVTNDGSFIMFGGVIKNNGASGVHNTSKFVMNGGVVIDNSAANGGGVYNRGINPTAANFTMNGGVITGNTADYKGGGLYNEGVAVINDGRIFANKAGGNGGGVYQDGTLTVDHGAYINGNTVNGKANNVYILAKRKINIGSSLSGTVGITLENAPTGSGKVEFATGNINSKTASKLKSDSSSFTIKQSGGKLTLSKKTTTDDDESDYELDILRVDSEDVSRADRTAIINLLKTMPDWVVGAYYDVTLWEDDEQIDDAGESLTVKLTIPSSIRAANREFKVVRVHDGRATVLDSTVDSGRTTITVKSRYFSTYAIIYSVSQSGSASGNGTSSNGGYTNPSMGVQNEIPLAALACGFTVMALAAPGKKLD